MFYCHLIGHQILLTLKHHIPREYFACVPGGLDLYTPSHTSTVLQLLSVAISDQTVQW